MGTAAAAVDYCPLVLGIYDHAVYTITGWYGCDGRVAQPAIVRMGNRGGQAARRSRRGMQSGHDRMGFTRYVGRNGLIGQRRPSHCRSSS